MTRKARSNLAYFLFIGAVAAGIVGFIVGKNATDSYRPQPPGMWVLYGLAGVLVLGAIFVLASTPSTSGSQRGAVGTPSLVPGWYDDPDDPLKLRYWDGQEWTAKSVDKPSP